MDDDALLLESLRDFFDARGIENRVYKSADDFLQSGDVGSTRCVLTDLKMPGTSGLQLLEELVRQGGPPVCIMTAYAEVRAKRAAELSGAAGFLEKPICAADLLAFIDSVRKP